MTNYEYKVIHCKPTRTLLMPRASQKTKDMFRRMEMENQINQAAAEGWEVISCSTASTGNLVWILPMATILLRRERRAEQVGPSDVQKGT